MNPSRLDPQFIERLQRPIDGDTALMRAIRAGDQESAEVLLGQGGELSGRNVEGETALYLALQAGEFEMAERLFRLGARDADDIVADERFTAEPGRCLKTELMTKTELDRILALYPAQTVMRVLTGDGKRVVRSRVAEIVEEIYPRCFWRKPLEADQRKGSTECLASLEATGLARLGQVFRPEQVADIRRHLFTEPIYRGHVPNATDGKPKRVSELEREGGQACYDPEVVLSAPHLVDLANNPIILTAVSEYFGFSPTIYSANIHWSFPHKREDAAIFSTESAHRDYNEYRDVALFIYLNDVGPGCGPHRYFTRTHMFETTVDVLRRRFSGPVAALIAHDMSRSILDAHGRTGLVEELFSDELNDITGPAGTAFLVDVHGYHRAFAPREGARLMAWFRYGASLGPDRNRFQAAQSASAPDLDPYINRMMPSIRTSMCRSRSENRVSQLAVPPLLLVNGYADTAYNICEFDGDIYAVHQQEGPFDIEKIRSGQTVRPVYVGRSLDAVTAKLNSAVPGGDAPA